MTEWGYSKRKKQAYPKKPRIQGVRSSAFPEGIAEHNFKEPELDDFQIAELEEFNNDKKEDTNEENQIKKIGQALTWGAFLEGAFAITAFATGQLWILPAFEAYRAGDFAYKIAKKLEDRQVDKAIDELLKKKLSVEFRRLSDPRVNEISGALLCAFCETGLSDMVSRETALDRNVVDTMFKGTVNGVLDNGIENLVDFVVDVI